ncbi:nuclease-like protein [Paramyrothecium foliicola]|nr:nuclease-like protein [Paramyrothecium foliicola]
MGVTGLLPLLKSIQRPTELKKFQGQILGVDAYGWLHRAAYSCASELGQGLPTKKYINTAMHRVRMLQHFGITPYMVFDGDFLPSKAGTEDSRAKSRDAKKKSAMALLKAGKTSQAMSEFQKCIDVTPEMASSLIQQLKKFDIPYVVAPYEADAQLVYLERKGLINGILSDDSDLLVFGAKRLLTKLDQYGNCIEINRRDFCACREVSLTGWSDTEFRRMAILSGCDYLNGLPGVGLKTAYRLVRQAKSPERIVKMVQFQGKHVSENYLTQFYQAELTFLHQWVFCPEKKELVHLTELDGTRTADDMPFIGSYVEPSLAHAIAKGDVNPITKLTIVIPTTPSKRRHSQANHTVPEQPRTKTINSYFKGHHRIPMGEMDPNCFTVDPQRLSQLTGGGLVPRVFPLPRPYLNTSRNSTQSTQGSTSRVQRRRTEPITNLLSRLSETEPPSSPSVAEVRSNSSPAIMKSESHTRPPKKARLCDETDGAEGSPKKSKFFPPAKEIKRPIRSKSDAYLLSDDSIDDVLNNLPDIDGWLSPKKPKKTIHVFEEQTAANSQQTSQEILVRDDNQESSGQDDSQASNSGTSQSTMQSSVAADPEDPYINSPAASQVSMPPPKQNRHTTKIPMSTTPSRSSIKQFAYSSSALATPASSISSRSSVFSTASAASTAPSTARSRLTPLQRLGAKALNTTTSPKPLAQTRQPIAHKSILGGLPVNPSFVPLPKVDLKEVEALNKSCGSEDQIIPDSDGEAEEADEDFDIQPRRLDLSRFICS